MSKKINKTVKNFCAKMLATSPKTQREIAALLDVREETISRWKKDEDFSALMSRFQEEAEKELLRRLRASSVKAFEKIFELMNCGDHKVEYQAAKEVLNLSGINAEIDGQGSNGKLDVLIKGFLDG